LKKKKKKKREKKIEKQADDRISAANAQEEKKNTDLHTEESVTKLDTSKTRPGDLIETHSSSSTSSRR
jgi:hypothetical protein